MIKIKIDPELSKGIKEGLEKLKKMIDLDQLDMSKINNKVLEDYSKIFDGAKMRENDKRWIRINDTSSFALDKEQAGVISFNLQNYFAQAMVLLDKNHNIHYNGSLILLIYSTPDMREFKIECSDRDGRQFPSDQFMASAIEHLYPNQVPSYLYELICNILNITPVSNIVNSNRISREARERGLEEERRRRQDRIERERNEVIEEQERESRIRRITSDIEYRRYYSNDYEHINRNRNNWKQNESISNKKQSEDKIKRLKRELEITQRELDNKESSIFDNDEVINSFKILEV